MAGSQLTQLKAALSTAGVTGQKPSKKRKRLAPLQKDKDKRAAKIEEIHRRLNPFDVKVTKLKHDVGGRKIKGVTGRPAQSKQTGIEQRKKTLLKEYEDKDRAGGILDRRFGENDPTMSLEERMLERFTRERQRGSKGMMFNLEDVEDLTHYGQSLSKLDDFDDIGLRMESDDEDETSGQIGRDVVSKTHFGGFDDDDSEDEDEPSRKKTKAEVMAEVIAKSKEHKLRRQMEQDAADNVRHELDGQFASLRELIYAPDPSSSASIVEQPFENSEESVDPIAAKLLPYVDDYDQHVRELAFDQRAKPKDRTKTEEELALEAKVELEEAERRRQRRMLGLPESEDENELGNRRGKRKRGADDLNDDFDEDLGEYEGLGAGLEQPGSNLSDEGDTNSDDEPEDSAESDGGVEEGAEVEVEGESEGEGLDEDDGDLDSEEGEFEQLITPPKTAKGKSKEKAMTRDLPFTFPCPNNHDEFLEIVEDIDDKDTPTVVQRICALYHSSLAPDNKFKLQKLATVLIDHVLYVASLPRPRFSLISSLLPHIFTITHAYPISVAQHFNAKLALMHKNLKRGLSRDALKPETKTWPGIPELLLLRTVGLLWSASDLNHAVVSPTRILMGAYLSLCRVRSLVDLASGLFLSTLFLQFEALSKRLVPEAISFLVNTVLHLAPHHYKKSTSLPGFFPCPDFKSGLCKRLAMNVRKRKSLVFCKAELSSLMTAKDDDEQAKADLLGLAFEMLAKYADLYKSIEGFIELFDPVLSILEDIEVKFLFEGHKDQLSKLIDSIRRLLKFSRQARRPLQLQAHKPIPIPTYVPKFETSNSSYLRQRDPDHEKNEAAKLRAQFKQERKGAIRELRKDARFLANVEQKKQIEKDRAYNERMKRVVGSIESERAEERKMEREKSREKRRAGRK